MARAQAQIPSESGPSPIDVHVGARIRLRRRLLGFSQQKLAEALDLTFQQVQKYERGTNRVSASKLYEVARFLKVPVGYFFEELPDPAGDADDAAVTAAATKDKDVQQFLRTHEGLELVRHFPHVRPPAVRRSLLLLIRTVADGDDAAA